MNRGRMLDRANTAGELLVFEGRIVALRGDLKERQNSGAADTLE